MVAKNSVTFEEALNFTGFGEFNIRALLVGLSLLMGMTFEVLSVAYLVPASACDLHTTVTQQGLMAGMPLLGIIATSHFLGYMADTRGRRRVLGWSMWVAFACGAAAALSPNWIVFCVLKFMSAGALAGTIALALTWLSESTPQNRRSVLVSLTSSMYPVTAGLMAGAICMFSSYESPRYYLRMGEEEKDLEVLRAIFAINSGKKEEDYEVVSVVLGEDTGEPSKGMISSIFAQTLPLLKPPLLKYTLLLSVLFVIAYAGAMAVCLTLMIGRASSVVGINILKNMIATDCELAVYGFAGLTLVGGFIALLLPNDVKKCKKGPAESISS